MKKTLDELTVLEAAEAIKHDAIVTCPDPINDSCAYQYDPQSTLTYESLGNYSRWPKCENCGHYLVVEWENEDEKRRRMEMVKETESGGEIDYLAAALQQQDFDELE